MFLLLILPQNAENINLTDDYDGSDISLYDEDLPSSISASSSNNNQAETGIEPSAKSTRRIPHHNTNPVDPLHKNLLFVQTSSGNLDCIDIRTGTRLWSRIDEESKPLTIYGEPIADNEKIYTYNGIIAPNPENGEIYIIDSSNSGSSGKKSYNIRSPTTSVQSLVERSPIRNDLRKTILTSQKKDMWIDLDLRTGKNLLNSKNEPFCDDEEQFVSDEMNHFDQESDFDQDESFLETLPTKRASIAHALTLHDHDLMQSKNTISLIRADYILSNEALFDMQYSIYPNSQGGGGHKFDKGDTLWNITYSQYQINEKIAENFPQKYYYSNNYLVSTKIGNGKILWNLGFDDKIINVFTWSKKYAAMLNVPKERLSWNVYKHVMQFADHHQKKICVEINSQNKRLINGIDLTDTVKFSLQKSATIRNGLMAQIESASETVDMVQPNAIEDQSKALDNQPDSTTMNTDLAPIGQYGDLSSIFFWDGSFTLPQPSRCICYVKELICRDDDDRRCVPIEGTAEFMAWQTIKKIKVSNRQKYIDQKTEKLKNRRNLLENKRSENDNKNNSNDSDTFYLYMLYNILVKPFPYLTDPTTIYSTLFFMAMIYFINKLVISTYFGSNDDERRNNYGIYGPDDVKKNKLIDPNLQPKVIQKDNIRVIGELSYDNKQVLGSGSYGTKVFKGTFQKRPCAVKRLLMDNVELANKEISLLRKNDYHQNVIRYYASEQEVEFLYIALELCECTLEEYIKDGYARKWRNELNSVVNKQAKNNKNHTFLYSKNYANEDGRLEVTDAMFETIRGVVHLHSTGVVHRDIKPSNILIARQANGSRRIVVSDFGLARQMDDGRVSFSMRSKTGLAGTQGWIAPELLDYGFGVDSIYFIFYTFWHTG